MAALLSLKKFQKPEEKKEEKAPAKRKEESDAEKEETKKKPEPAKKVVPTKKPSTADSDDEKDKPKKKAKKEESSEEEEEEEESSEDAETKKKAAKEKEKEKEAAAAKRKAEESKKKEKEQEKPAKKPAKKEESDSEDEKPTKKKAKKEDSDKEEADSDDEKKEAKKKPAAKKEEPTKKAPAKKKEKEAEDVAVEEGDEEELDLANAPPGTSFEQAAEILRKRSLPDQEGVKALIKLRQGKTLYPNMLKTGHTCLIRMSQTPEARARRQKAFEEAGADPAKYYKALRDTCIEDFDFWQNNTHKYIQMASDWGVQNHLTQNTNNRKLLGPDPVSNVRCPMGLRDTRELFSVKIKGRQPPPKGKEITNRILNKETLNHKSDTIFYPDPIYYDMMECKKSMEEKGSEGGDGKRKRTDGSQEEEGSDQEDESQASTKSKKKAKDSEDEKSETKKPATKKAKVVSKEEEKPAKKPAPTAAERKKENKEKERAEETKKLLKAADEEIEKIQNKPTAKKSSPADKMVMDSVASVTEMTLKDLQSGAGIDLEDLVTVSKPKPAAEKPKEKAPAPAEIVVAADSYHKIQEKPVANGLVSVHRGEVDAAFQMEVLKHLKDLTSQVGILTARFNNFESGLAQSITKDVRVGITDAMKTPTSLAEISVNLAQVTKNMGDLGAKVEGLHSELKTLLATATVENTAAPTSK